MTEIGRRLVHASGVGAPLSYLLGVFTWEQLGWVLAAGLAGTLLLEFARLRSGLDWWIYENLTREYEREKVAGYALYMVGMAVVALAAPPEIGVPAMFMLAIGDPVGGYLGKGAATKSPVALAAVFGVCLLVALPFVPPVAAVLGAMAATAADGYLITIRGSIVDDNLTIPLAAALAMWVGVALV
ncbi:diacylglycerol/polyprenol kinase family protein [Halalkalicoccus subterraneus]|uniref:diacylglycerol/polyprenol kinase family protein n=1 Tax=Halalkalicoccus subterraneus TaxID=2675002 RepID=UPI000EFB6563|nr:dolichol kinase [Halalkalicoccus subterraneus]